MQGADPVSLPIEQEGYIEETTLSVWTGVCGGGLDRDVLQAG